MAARHGLPLRHLVKLMGGMGRKVKTGVIGLRGQHSKIFSKGFAEIGLFSKQAKPTSG